MCYIFTLTETIFIWNTVIFGRKWYSQEVHKLFFSLYNENWLGSFARTGCLLFLLVCILCLHQVRTNTSFSIGNYCPLLETGSNYIIIFVCALTCSYMLDLQFHRIITTKTLIWNPYLLLIAISGTNKMNLILCKNKGFLNIQIPKRLHGSQYE